MIMWSYAKIVMAAFIVVALVVGADSCCGPEQLTAKVYLDGVFKNYLYIDYKKDVILEIYDGRAKDIKYILVKPKRREAHVKMMNGECKKIPFSMVAASNPRCMPSDATLIMDILNRRLYIYKIKDRYVNHGVRSKDCRSLFTYSTIDTKKYNDFDYRNVKSTVDNSDVFKKDCS